MWHTPWQKYATCLLGSVQALEDMWDTLEHDVREGLLAELSEESRIRGEIRAAARAEKKAKENQASEISAQAREEFVRLVETGRQGSQSFRCEHAPRLVSAIRGLHSRRSVPSLGSRARRYALVQLSAHCWTD